MCHHLLVCGYALYIGRDGDKEVDFVAERNGEKLYVQVAYSVIDPKTHEREFGNLLAIQDNYPKIVVTMDEVEGVSYQGIEQVPVRKFCFVGSKGGCSIYAVCIISLKDKLQRRS